MFLGYSRTRRRRGPRSTRTAGSIRATWRELDADGYLHVTDRKKELIITSGGKKTGPAVLESHLKHLPAVAQAVVVGDGRNYLAALFTLDPLRVGRSPPRPEARRATSAAASVCPAFRAHLGRAIDRGQHATSPATRAIKRFAVLATEFTVDGGELTPTLKLKRRVNRTQNALLDASWPGGVV